MSEFDELIDKLLIEYSKWHKKSENSVSFVRHDDIYAARKALNCAISDLLTERDGAVAKLNGWHFITNNPESQPDKTDDYQVLKNGDETYSVDCGWASEGEIIAWKEQENEQN